MLPGRRRTSPTRASRKEEKAKGRFAIADTTRREYTIPLKRHELITQLRHALNLATSPRETVIEFDIFETTFEVDFTDEKKGEKS